MLIILLENAVAHSPAQFPMVIQAGDDGEVMLVSILDRGVRVPEEKRELIFERFYQTKDAMHHPARGMGLGLNIAREIVEAHGGASGMNPARAAAPLSASPSPDVRMGSCVIPHESCDHSLVDFNLAPHHFFSFPAGVDPSS